MYPVVSELSINYGKIRQQNVKCYLVLYVMSYFCNSNIMEVDVRPSRVLELHDIILWKYWFIYCYENRFFSYKMHSNHSFPTLHSSQLSTNLLSPSDPPHATFSLQEKEGVQEAMAK